MHPAAKKCVEWSIGLFVLGTLAMVYLPDLFRAVARVAGANADVGLRGLNLAFTFVQMSFFPVAAALVGSAVVIQVLAGQAQRPGEARDRNINRKA